MRTVILYATTDYGYVYGESSDYSTARGTASGYEIDDSVLEEGINVGQSTLLGGYLVTRGFLKFPTGDIPDDAIVLNASMRLGTRRYDAEDRVYSVDIIKQDWSAYDPITNANKDSIYDACLAGTKDVTWKTFYLGYGYIDYFYSPFLDTSYISTTDYTYYSLRSSRDFANSAPTGREYAAIWSADYSYNYLKPALLVDYYTPPAASANIAYMLDIDWVGDQASTSYSDEASRVTRFVLDRGRDEVVGGSGSGYSTPSPGRLILDLDNHDGRFDPWNTDSPIYSYLRPGKRVSFSCVYDSVYYDLFTGFIEDIQPTGNKKAVTMTVIDGAGWLANRIPDISLQESTGVDAAINAILDDLIYPFGRDIEAGVTTFDYYWTSGANGLTEIHNLATADMGRFCVEADGVAHFYGRHNYDAPAHTLTESILGKDIFIPMPWEYSRYIVDVYAYPRQVGSTNTTLFTLRDTPEIERNETLTLWAKYKYEDQYVPATGVTVASYEPSTAFPSTNVVLTAYSRDAKIEITNNQAGTETLTALTLEGTPIYSPDPVRVQEVSTASDNPATFVFDYEWLNNINTAQDFADVLLEYFEEDKKYPEVMLYNRPETALGIDLEERINLQLDTFSVDDIFAVAKITHQSGSSMQELITTIKLYPLIQNEMFVVSSTDYGILNTNKLGF